MIDDARRIRWTGSPPPPGGEGEWQTLVERLQANAEYYRKRAREIGSTSPRQAGYNQGKAEATDYAAHLIQREDAARQSGRDRRHAALQEKLTRLLDDIRDDEHFKDCQLAGDAIETLLLEMQKEAEEQEP